MKSCKLLPSSIALFTFGGVFALYAKSTTIVCCGLALILFFLPFLSKIGYLKSPSTSKTFNVIYYFLLIWEVFIISYPMLMGQGFVADGYSLRVDYTLPAYFLPLMLLLGKDSVKLGYLFKIAPFLFGFSLLTAFFYRRFWFEDYASLSFDDYQDALQMTGPLMGLLKLGLLLMPFASYIHQKHTKIMIFTCVSLYLLFVIMAARRGDLAVALLYVFTYAYFTFYYGKRKIPKWLILCVVAVCISVGVYYLLQSDIVSYLLERGTEDTRSYVEFCMYSDFADNYADWILGRGINGVYFCPSFKNPMRGIIETGYLFMILKGGIVYLFLYVFLFFHAIRRGIKSGNTLLKIMAVELIIRLFSLYPSGLPSFSFTDYLCWFFILHIESYPMFASKTKSEYVSHRNTLINAGI